jgi:hypothetical protein
VFNLTSGPAGATAATLAALGTPILHHLDPARPWPATSPALPVTPAVPAELRHDPTARYPGPGQIG